MISWKEWWEKVMDPERDKFQSWPMVHSLGCKIQCVLLFLIEKTILLIFQKWQKTKICRFSDPMWSIFTSVWRQDTWWWLRDTSVKRSNTRCSGGYVHHLPTIISWNTLWNENQFPPKPINFQTPTLLCSYTAVHRWCCWYEQSVNISGLNPTNNIFCHFQPEEITK